MKSFNKLSVMLVVSSSLFASTIQMGWAKELSNPPAVTHHPVFSQIKGVVETVIPQVGTLSPKDIKEEKTYQLADGTKIPTLMYRGTNAGPRPLIIANFGLFTDKGAGAIGRFVHKLAETGELNADILIVGNVSSATFYTENKEFGLGGYDEGKVLVELAQQIRNNNFQNSSIELMGVSLGGCAVVQALIEDARLGRKDFQSAIVFSAVLNEGESSASLLAAFGHPIITPMGPALSPGGNLLSQALILGLKKTLKAEGNNLEFKNNQTGDLFYNNFKHRLERLRSNRDTMANWNPKVSTDSVEDYLVTSSNLVASEMDKVETPLLVVHAKNDPLVPYSQFDEFARREDGNPRIYTLSTKEGGHFGFATNFGDQWEADLISRARDLK